MADSPTIVAAHLSDDALKQSVNSLVSQVNDAIQSMATNFDKQIGNMEARLKQFSSTKYDTGGSADGGSSKRTQKLKDEETQAEKTAAANKKVAETFDQQAQAMQNATAPKSARDSYLAFQRGYKEQAEQIGKQIREAEEALNRSITNRINELNSKLASAKTRLNELNTELARQRMEAERTGNYSTYNAGIARTTQAIEYQMKHIAEIQKQISEAPNMFANQERHIASLRAEHERVANIMKEEIISQQTQSASEERATQTISKQSEELKKQLQLINEIRNSKQARAALENISAMPAGDVEQAKAKLTALQELKEKVANTPLLSTAKTNQLNQAIEATAYKITSLESKAKGDAHVVSDSVKDMNAAVEANRKASIKAEEEKRQQIVQTGLTAQQTAKTIGEAMSKQLSNGEQITQVKELENAWRQMQQALNNMTQEQLKSPVGQMLAETTAKTELALTAVRKYNEELSRTNTQQTPRTPSSYNELNEILKQLTNTYKNLSKEERNAAKGTQLADKIQRIGREAQKAQQQMNRPINLDAALKGSERTLDDIAYKMQRLRAYRQGIDLTKPTAANEIKQVDEALARLQKDADKWMSKSQEMVKSNTALGRSWNYMKNRLAFYFTVGASTSFVKNLIEVRSQYEMNERALGILIDSAERGTRIFNELSQMALVSPYTLIELSTAAKQLTAYDIAAKDVVDTTRRLADMAAAVGIPIERLTYALGQIKAYGYLNARDARMFSNAGIPLVKQLSDYYSQLEGRIVSVGDVYDRIKKKAIGMADVMQVINKMTDEGGKFFDFQAKMAGTLKVQLANLTLAWNNMLNDMGASEQGIITAGISGLKELFLRWQDIQSAITKVVYAFGLYKTAQMISLIWTGRITTAMGMQELVGKKLQTRLAGLTASNKAFISATTAGYAALALVITDILMTWSRNVEEIERLNKTIEDGAKEASEALDKMSHSSEMVSARLSASSGKLSTSNAEKTWERLREQIELSALSNKELISQLILEEDLNKRVSEAFTLAESIEKATQKLSNLNNALDISQDSILMGLFGEGIIEDIDDYNAHLKRSGEIADWTKNKTNEFWKNSATAFKYLFEGVKETLGSSEGEAIEEIRNFSKNAANVIKEELGEEGLRDKVQVNEAIARVMSGMEQMYPKIRGKGKILFETLFNETMAAEFAGSVDKQAYYYVKFLEQLKKDHASAFGDITEEVLDSTYRWSSAQMDAINKTADKLKKDMPEASQDAIDEILRQLNSTEFKVRIVAELSTTSVDEVNKEFKKKFITTDAQGNVLPEKQQNENMQKYGTLLRKNGEDNVAYEKRISDERKNQLEISKKNADIIAENKNKTDALSKAITKDAEKEKKAADAWLDAANDVAKAGGYNFSTKNERSDANKAQKAAESELQKALKEELQLIDKVRSAYKTLTKEGASRNEAITQSVSGYEESLKNINNVLNKYGIGNLDLTKFAGVDNPREIVNMLQTQVNNLLKSGVAKHAEVQELQVKIKDLKLDATAFDYKKLTTSLNNELGKLKDEYELAVELDASPELGSVFMDMMGISEEQLKDLPKDFSGVMTKLQGIIDDKLGNGRFDLAKNLNKTAFDSWVKANNQGTAEQDELVKQLNAIREYANKVRFDSTKKQIQEWDKLLEKYAEYETRVTKIQKEAEHEREVARRQGASQEIIDAINNREARELAKLSFEEFQRTPEWIIATGDLAGLTDSAINVLIDSIERYKKTARNLDPKQIKQINKALVTLYKEQRKGNPFNVLSNYMKEAKQRAEELQPEITKTENEINSIGDAINEAIENGEDISKLKDKLSSLEERLKKLKKLQSDLSKLSPTEIVEGINAAISVAKQAAGVFTDMMDAIGGEHGSLASKRVKEVFGVLESAGSYAAMGASIGGVYGAVIGGVIGVVSGAVSTWVDEWSGNASITRAIEASERAVKRLEISYNNLEDAANNAYAAMVSGAKKALQSNKELQLAELERQLALEKSRSSKNRDEDRILELQGQIAELRNEIRNASQDIINDLLGISSAGDAIEQMVSAMVDAFRNGEDAMKAFGEKWDEMIDNMILKLIVSQYMQKAWDELMSRMQNMQEEYLNASSDKKAAAKAEVERLAEMSDYKLAMEMFEKGLLSGIDPHTSYDDFKAWLHGSGIDTLKPQLEAYRKAAEQALTSATETLENESFDYTKWSLEYMNTEGREYMEKYAQALKDALGNWYTYGENAETNLSALQQGIQGITEDTAGALEAYMNGVSQQVYLQSRMITEIRDAIVGFDLDVQVATMGQMLMQLQASYQVQMSIQGILEGVLNPSGRAFNVELIS